MQPLPADELGEDPPHDGRGHRVGLEPVQPAAVVALAGVGVRAGVGEAIAEWWSSALEASLDRDLGFHRGAHAGLDAVAFAFAHAAVERHDDFMRVAAGIDRAADLGHPELDAVVHEDGERESELVAVERSLWFTDHDCVEAAIVIGERLEEAGRLGTSSPRQRSRLAEIEVLADDFTVGRFDQLTPAGQLPVP